MVKVTTGLHWARWSEHLHATNEETKKPNDFKKGCLAFRENRQNNIAIDATAPGNVFSSVALLPISFREPHGHNAEAKET